MKQLSKAFKSTFRKRPFTVFILIISILGGIGMQLIPPQILRSIIDNYISKGKIEGIWTLAFIYLLVVLLSGIFDFFREFTMAIVGENMLSEIRYSMAKKLSKLPISYFSNNSVGGIMSYFTSDVDAVGTLVTSGVIGIIADGLKALGIIVSIYLLNPKLSIYVLILIPIIYTITKVFKRATLKAQIATRKALGKINGYIQEVFNGIRTIKIFSKESYFINLFQAPLNENINAVHRTSTFDSVFPCIMQVLRAVAITIIVLLAAPKGIGDIGLTIGSIAACVDLLSRMLSPIESIAMEFQTIQEAISGLKRIEEFENLVEEEKIYKKNIQDDVNIQANTSVCDSASTLNNAVIKDKIVIKTDTIIKDDTSMEDDALSINVNNLCFSYEKGKKIVNNISFQVKAGSKVALVGKTGAGKSTILNLVAGLYKPSEGNINIEGIDPFLIPPHMRRRILGIVPQNFNIYDGTVRDAITLYDKNITDEEVILAAKRVGLHEEIMKLKDGYDTLIGEGERQLSNGQYQLLTLACAIVCNPPVLLLDEVTSGLDAITEQRVFSVLKEICEHRTLLTISHRVSGIVDADEVIILKEGRIIESGSPKELAGKEGWYAKYNQIESLGWQSM